MVVNPTRQVFKCVEFTSGKKCEGNETGNGFIEDNADTAMTTELRGVTKESDIAITP